MAANRFGGVVFIAQHPVDFFGPPRRNRAGQSSAGSHDPCQFGDRGNIVLNVFKYFRSNDTIKSVVGKWQFGGVAAQRTHIAIGGNVFGFDHCAESCTGHTYFLIGVIKRNDATTQTGNLKCVATKAGASIKYKITRGEPKLFKANGQHGLFHSTISAQFVLVGGHR